MANRVPGQRTGRTNTPRYILRSPKGVLYIPGGGVIDATYAYDGSNTSYETELRPGLIMGMITATQLWVPCKLTTVASGTSGSGTGTSETAITVTDARTFKADDPVTVPASGGAGNVDTTISSINYTTNVITLAAAVDNVNIGGYVIGRGALAGAEIPRAILNEFVDLVDHDDNTARDRTVSELVTHGVVDDDMILGDLAAARAYTTTYINHILFDDRQGAG